MNDRPRNKHRIQVFALLVALAAVAVGFAAMPAVAAPASESGDGYRPSAWAETSDPAPAGETPTLTDSGGQPEGGTGSQLPIGLGLVGLGLLGLVFGLVKQVKQRPGVQTRPGTYVVKWQEQDIPPRKPRHLPE